MIIDFHTHIFPPDVRERREEYVQRDATFAEMYSNPKAKIATAEDLLHSMDAAGVDVSVALGFAWRDHELCVRHNDYLLESAAASDGRIIPFCTINPAAGDTANEIERCATAGAKGLGELRPESQVWDLIGEVGQLLATLAAQHNLILLFHVTEPGGHEYPGKAGLQLGPFFRFVVEHPELSVVGAHFAGGLPFAMTKHRATPPRAYADTAARRFLYPETVYQDVIACWGADRLLLASDFPLVSQVTQIEDARANMTDHDALATVLGDNAARLLGIAPRLDAPGRGVSADASSER